MIKGFRRGSHLKPKVTEEMVERIKSLREEGRTYDEIGAELGISATTARYHNGYREKAIANALRWQANHPERAKESRRRFRRRHQSRYAGRYMKQKKEREELNS